MVSSYILSCNDSLMSMALLVGGGEPRSAPWCDVADMDALVGLLQEVQQWYAVPGPHMFSGECINFMSQSARPQGQSVR